MESGGSIVSWATQERIEVKKGEETEMILVVEKVMNLSQLINKLKEIFKSDFSFCLFADCIEYDHKEKIEKISKACMAEDGTLYITCSHEDVAHSEVQERLTKLSELSRERYWQPKLDQLNLHTQEAAVTLSNFEEIKHGWLP